MRSLLTFAWIAAVALTFGCSNEKMPVEPTPASAQSDGLIFLQKGNYWLYQKVNTINNSRSEVRWEITDVIDLAGQPVFELSYADNGVWRAGRHYLRNQADGLYIYAERRADGIFAVLPEPKAWLLYPTAVGQSFSTWLGDEGRLRATNKNIGVPAGGFYCLKYEIGGEGRYTSLFCEAHTGIVAQFLYTTETPGEGRLIETLELVRYQFGR